MSVLYLLTIYPAPDRKLLRVGNLICRGDPGSQRREAIHAFGTRRLWGLNIELILSCAEVVGRHVSKHVAQRRMFAHIFSGFADNHRKLCKSEEHTSELQSLMRISYAV